MPIEKDEPTEEDIDVGSFLKGDIKNTVKILEVLEVNFPAFEIYQRCNHNLVGMSGSSAGIEASTVISTMNVLSHRLPQDPESRAIIFDSVLYMGSVAAKIFNEKGRKRT